jgi:hypothetical protein
VTSGVKAGETVVLADLSEALPTSSTTSNRTGTFGQGGFTGAPSGSFTGPPPGGFTRGG